MPRPLRAALWLAYLAYLGWVVFLVWTPSPSLPGSAIGRLVNILARFGITVTSSSFEFVLNIVMLVPLSLLGGLLFRRLRVSDWTAIGFGASLLIEVVQRLLLPTRFGSSRDIVANTLGAFLGAALLALAIAVLTQRQSATTADDRREPTDRMTP